MNPSSSHHGAPRPADAPPVAGQHPLDWPAAAGAVDDVLSAMHVRIAARRRRTRRRTAAMIGMTMILLVSGYAFRATQATPRTVSASATVAKVRQQILPDGSVMELKPGAGVSVEFTHALRRVRVHDGEVHFDVVKDPQRPFVVIAADVEFRAVGTAFIVQRDAASVELLVTEGTVAVASSSKAIVETPPGHAEDADVPEAFVFAGSRAVVNTSPDATTPEVRVETVSASVIRERTAWRVPTVELSATPLGEALAAFSRYSRQRLVLADARLERIRLSGVLRADNVETLLGLLEESHGVRVERRGENEIVLHRR